MIVFSEWTPLANQRFKRRDYTYEGIINADTIRKNDEGKLFEMVFSKEEHGLIKEYKPVNYKEIQYAKD